jgi:hypothetical protein
MVEPLATVPRSILKSIIPVLIVLVSVPGLGLVQQQMDDMLEEEVGNQLLYFPNDNLLRHFTAGLSGVLSDWMWYQTVQYTGEEFMNQDSKFTWLEHMIRTTTALSPGHEDAYRYGGSFLAVIGSDDTGMEILKEGFINNPKSWTIPYEMHTIYLMNRRDDENSNLYASRYAYLVAERHDPEYRSKYFTLAQSLLKNENMNEEAVRFFSEKVANATDPVLRGMAESQLRVAVIEQNLDALNLAVDTYKARQNRFPNNLQDLLDAGFVNALPDDPEEGEYLIDPRTNRVVNLTIQLERLDYLTRKLSNHAANFAKKYGRNPDSLDELWEYRNRKPAVYPFPEGYWEYDPESGVVTAPQLQ